MKQLKQLYDVSEDERICRAFAFAAYETWGELRDFPELGEESITDFRLLQLKRMCPEEVRVIKFSKPKEAKTGADWEWWFGSGNEWFGMRVQAKKLDAEKLQYSYLDHKIGKQQLSQVEQLIKNAGDSHLYPLYPLYCFYNYFPTLYDVGWNCGTFERRQELWGASIADARLIKQCVDSGKTRLSHISKICKPLMCLACCKGHSDNRGNFSLPHRARGIARALSRDADSVPDLIDHLPWYANSNSNHGTLARSNESPSHLRALDGVLVIQERPFYNNEE